MSSSDLCDDEWRASPGPRATQPNPEKLLFWRPGKPAYELPLQYRYDADEAEAMKVQKFNYRLRDLYVSQAANRAVLLPDWRVRGEDRLPRLELFLGDLRSKHRRKEYERHTNIEALPITDFVLQCK